MRRIGKHSMGWACLAAVGMALPLTIATAGEIGEIQWHGYLTSAVMTSSAGNYAGDVSSEGSTKDTRMGLTLSTQVDESLQFAAQFEAEGVENFAMDLDWAFASYSLSDSVTLRFGKIKYPVGLYNEYISVGYTYPWIRAPEGFYNQDAIGPNLTREAYQGFGADFSTYMGDTEVGLDIFGGAVDVPDGKVNQLIGVKFSTNTEDAIRFELAVTTGLMDIKNDQYGRQMMMDGERHTAFTAGFALDLSQFVLSTEFGSASMGMKMMDMTSGYLMMGYRLGDYMPNVTWEQWDVNGGWGQEVLSVGLRKELTTNSALKFEVRQVTPVQNQKPGPIDTTHNQFTGGYGLFSDTPMDKDITIIGLAIEMVF
jgi:hypothetical protein